MATLIPFIAYTLLFLGVIFFVNAATGFVRLAQGEDEEAVERRLAKLSAAAAGRGVTHDRLYTESASQRWVFRIPFFKEFNTLVRTSGTGMTPQRTLVTMALIAAGVFLVLLVFIPRNLIPLTPLLAIVSSVGLVLLYLRRARAKRRALFEEQLPDAIDLIIRSLKVGHPMSAAMGVISRELPPPISTEFGIAFQEVTYGHDVPTAMANMASRMPVPDLRYLTMAVQIQYDAGGNLIESLSKLSAVIRERYRMFRKVKALTAEGRFSAWFLSLFPLFVVVAIQLVKPDYFTRVMDFAFFPHLVAATAVLLVVNIIAMRIMTTLKV